MPTSNTDRQGPIPVQPPLYQRLTLILLGLVAFFFVLYVGQPIIVPLLFALLLAILLDPIVKFLTRKGLPRVLNIALAVLVAMAAILGLAYFIATQAAHFSETLPELKSKLKEMGEQVQGWVQDTAHVKASEVDEALEKVKTESMEKGGAMVGKTLATVGTLFGFFFLLPVFTFLTMLYKDLFLTFLSKLFPPRNHDALDDVLGQTKGVVQSYLIGLLFEAVIVTVLSWVGLLLIGVKYALLMAVLAAVLNLIPYIGMIVATLLPMLVALATKDATAALWVLGAYSAVQFIDNNLIVPMVVASRVQINALMSIIVVMIGGTLWGIPGMFLAIPMLAIIKVIFDRVPALEPFGYLLGGGDGKKESDANKASGTQKS